MQENKVYQDSNVYLISITVWEFSSLTGMDPGFLKGGIRAILKALHQFYINFAHISGTYFQGQMGKGSSWVKPPGFAPAI